MDEWKKRNGVLPHQRVFVLHPKLNKSSNVGGALHVLREALLDQGW